MSKNFMNGKQIKQNNIHENDSEEIIDNEFNQLSEEETKHYLTPFAFKLDSSLFGLPLASPTKRAFALLIDLSLIALLSEVSAGILALAIAVTLYRLGNKKRAQARGKRKGYKRRAVLRFTAAFILFILLLDTLPPLLKQMNFTDHTVSPQIDTNESLNELSIDNPIEVSAMVGSSILAISQSDCDEVSCWQQELSALAQGIAQTTANAPPKLSDDDISSIFKEMTNATNLNKSEQQQLLQFLRDAYFTELEQAEHHKTLSKSAAESSSVANITKAQDKSTDMKGQAALTDTHLTKKLTEQEESVKTNKPIYSIIELVKGIINDLGLGFGWATFYFTVFIALADGQTVGKKLFGIKVLQLDGTPLSMWDSFGRYGGYGAGLATGLLGFMQIYWDPNRQAIHDQISATVVIDVRKASL